MLKGLWRAIFVLSTVYLLLMAGGCGSSNSGGETTPTPAPNREPIVYVAGSWETRTGSIPSYWTDGVRTDLSVTGEYNNGYTGGAASSIVVSGSDIYVAGNVGVPCYWKNGARTDLSVPAAGEGRAESITVLGSSVYVAGSTRTSATMFVPCYWKNGVRTDLSVLDASQHAWGLSIFVANR
jgi:hypothetical protein